MTSLRGMVDGCRGLFWLRKTGNVEALDREKNAVGKAGYESIFDAPYPGFWSRIKQLRIEFVDEDGTTVWLSVFDPWRMRNADRHGFVLIDGEIRNFGPRTYLTDATEPPAEAMGRVWVRYVCPGAPSEAEVRRLVEQAKASPDSRELCAHALVASTLLSEVQLLTIAEDACGQQYADLLEFFQVLHEPDSPMDGDLAAAAARAMGVAGICSAARAGNMRYPHAKAALNLQPKLIQALIDSQPEILTGDQKKAIDGLVMALRAPQPLNGLLSGDVGTGKTLVFMVPAVAAHLVGAQVAIISPTEILANQVFKNLSRRFPQARVERVLAGGKIMDPSAILVGTSGLGGVARKAEWIPNFLVVDEQHKLATKDRNSMVAPWTHQLEASATPIPRSLASTLYSGTQVFDLYQSPVERNLESFVLEESERSSAVGWMRQALAENHRIAVIYPRVGSTAGGDAAVVNNVMDAAEALEKRFPGKVVMLHGKLGPGEVGGNLDSFRTGAKPIVVASTIMETGIDIADIRLMVVKDADNFGIAQLHQLRGRLARNGGAARFVMMVGARDDLSPDTLDRLATVARVTDGYALAEADMASRGFGDLAGSAQSGNVSCAFRLLRLELADFSV
ncbi:DEAD/DEAH box helicase [Polaromonas sp.]|uniref:DEAD/DEAH box helicase n=1 Tax=Polaromonas sp. TaxID=1869339 RepID=UPI00352A29EC